MMSRHDPAPRRQPAPPHGGRVRRRRPSGAAVTRLAFVGLLPAVLPAADATAATDTYTINSSVVNQWSAGSDWNAVPVSGSATTLFFTGVLGNGTINTSNNDIGPFQLSSLSISATGPNSGASGLFITGSALNFVSNSGTAPSVISVLGGSTLPAIVISTPIILGGNLTVDISPAVGAITFSGVVSGTDTLTKTGAGTLVLSVSTGNNTFTGDTRIVAGTLELGNVEALEGSTLDIRAGDTGIVTFGITPGTRTYKFGGLEGTRGIDNADNTLSVGGNGKSTTYAGALSGTGGLVKTGSGAVSGSVTLQNGATALLGVTGSSTFDEIIGTGGAFTNDGTLALSIDSSGTFANGTTLDMIHGFAGPHPGSFDTAHLVATGAYAGLNDTALVNTTFYGANVWASGWVNSDSNGRNGQRFLFDQTTGTLEIVPEPSTWALAAIAAATVGAARWRQRRRRAGRAAG